jgi:hypothetical protein
MMTMHALLWQVQTSVVELHGFGLGLEQLPVPDNKTKPELGLISGIGLRTRIRIGKVKNQTRNQVPDSISVEPELELEFLIFDF